MEPQSLIVENPTAGHLYVSWDEYHQLIEQLALQIAESQWQFESILCLARGGLRVGDVLSRIFQRPLGVIFTSSYRDQGGTRQSRLFIGDEIAAAHELPGPNLLLVDDLVDSGDTLTQLLPQLRSRWPRFAVIKTAVLWQKGLSKVRPDYAVQFLSQSPWIHQPFERYDVMRFDELARQIGRARERDTRS
jgi:uncharacterized protein